MATDKADKVVIDIVLDDGSVKQVFNRIEREAKETGDNAGKGMSVPMTRALGVIGAAATVAAAAVAAIATAMYKGTQAAMVQEDVVLGMNQALASAGRYSLEASREFQQFASEIQGATRIGDETTIAMLGLASTFTKTNDEAMSLVGAAVDLSAAMDMDLRSAVVNLGKTYAGMTGELGESVPIIRTLTKEQLLAGDAVGLIGQRFEGTAAVMANNFAGASIKAGNAFGDMMEQLGSFVTKSPVAVELVNQIKNGFETVGKSLAGFREGRDVMGEIIILSLKIGEALITYIGAPLNLIGNAARLVFNGMQTMMDGWIAGVVKGLNWLVQKLPDALSPDGLKETMRIAAESTSEVFTEQLDETKYAFDNMLNVDMAGSALKFTEDLRTTLENAEDLAEDFTNNTDENIKKLADKVDTYAQSISQAMNQGLTQGVVGAMQVLGTSLVKGGDAWESFKNTALNVMGDMAINIGGLMIAHGIGIEALKTSLYTLNGATAIAAGAALVAVGASLKALATSPGSDGLKSGSPANPVHTEPAPDAAADPINIADSMERKAPTTNVAINIHGDVLDSDETGLRIVNILNSAFDKQGVTIKGGVMA